MRERVRCQCVYALVIVALVHMLTLTSLSQSANNPPELVAVQNGVAGIESFVRSGHRFTGQKNARGQTVAMLAAASTEQVIQAFHNAGGQFNDEQDLEGRTAAIYLLEMKPRSGPGAVLYHQERNRAIAAYAKAGGRFSEKRDAKGNSPMYMIAEFPSELCAYRTAGGPVADSYSFSNRRELVAISAGAVGIHQFAASGGVFTSLTDGSGKTSEDWAKQSRGEVLAAYQDALKRQGGLEFLSADDEYSALKSPERTEAFRRAGCQFDDRPNKSGLRAEVIAILGGPKIVEAFSRNGGRFSDQADPQGLTSRDLAMREEPGNPGLLEAYRAAVKRQGGLVSTIAINEYEAIRMGSSGIEKFVRKGGRFDDVPNSQDLTPAMMAASSGPEVIDAFAKAGGRFTNWQNKLGYTAAMAAAYYGADAITAYVRSGGHFTNQQNHLGNSVEMIVAMKQDDTFPGGGIELHFPSRSMRAGELNRGREAIDAFFQGGGQFTEQQNRLGRTAAMYAVQNGPQAIKAFVRAGGRFTEQEDTAGLTSEIYAAFSEPDTIRAFAAAGGRFTDHLTSKGMSSELAAARGTAEQIRAFSESGGIFTDRKGSEGVTSAMLAKSVGSAESESLPPSGSDEASTNLIRKRKEQLAARDIEATRAYQEALTRQGGLRHVE